MPRLVEFGSQNSSNLLSFHSSVFSSRISGFPYYSVLPVSRLSRGSGFHLCRCSAQRVTDQKREEVMTEGTDWRSEGRILVKRCSTLDEYLFIWFSIFIHSSTECKHPTTTKYLFNSSSRSPAAMDPWFEVDPRVGCYGSGKGTGLAPSSSLRARGLIICIIQGINWKQGKSDFFLVWLIFKE